MSTDRDLLKKALKHIEGLCACHPSSGCVAAGLRKEITEYLGQQPITDACPICGTEYEWDACHDTYPKAMYESIDEDTVLFRCTKVVGMSEVSIAPNAPDGLLKCDAVFATMVADEHGQRVFVPSTKEL